MTEARVGEQLAQGSPAAANRTRDLLTASPAQYHCATETPLQVRLKKVKEADLYSAFIEVPYTQGAQVRITQCYLQTTPYLPLPRKHSPDGASQTLTLIVS